MWKVIPNFLKFPKFSKFPENCPKFQNFNYFSKIQIFFKISKFVAEPISEGYPPPPRYVRFQPVCRGNLPRSPKSSSSSDVCVCAGLSWQFWAPLLCLNTERAFPKHPQQLLPKNFSKMFLRVAHPFSKTIQRSKSTDV